MANPTTSSNVLKSIAQTAQYIQEKWTREVEQPFDEALHAAKLVSRRDGLVSDGGDTVRVPFASQVAARAKADNGTGITYDSPEAAAISYSIDKHYYSAVLIPDITKVQSNYNLKSVFQKRMAQALAEQIDDDLLALYGSAGSTVTGGAAVDDADMLSVVTAFDTAKTPSSQRRGIIGSNTKADLLGVNKYVAYDQTGKTGTAVGGGDFVGTIYGMTLHHSQNVPTSTTGRNLFFHKSAISLAEQQSPKYEMEYSVDQLGTKTVLHCIYGLGAERASSIIELTRTTAP